MTELNSPEPSMEEILASIRRIISEDLASVNPVAVGHAPVAADDDDVLILRERAPAEPWSFDKPSAHIPEASPPPAPLPPSPQIIEPAPPEPRFAEPPVVQAVQAEPVHAEPVHVGGAPFEPAADPTLAPAQVQPGMANASWSEPAPEPSAFADTPQAETAVRQHAEDSIPPAVEPAPQTIVAPTEATALEEPAVQTSPVTPPASDQTAAPVAETAHHEVSVVPTEESTLVAPEVAARAAASFERLYFVVDNAHSKPNLAVSDGGPTLADLTRDILNPLIKAWLDEHLESIVQARVEEEVARISRGRVR